MKEIYVSIDIETDGPIPGKNSMLSLGAAAFSPNGESLDTFYVNLFELPGAQMDPVTKREFWDKHPEAWAQCQVCKQNPEDAMMQFVTWLDSLEKKYKSRVVAVAYPAGFDFTYVYWYLMKFVGRSPFSFSCIDVKSYAMAVMGKTYRKSTKRGMPKQWFDKNAKHTHNALDDAIEQGLLWCNILKYNKNNTWLNK